MEGNIFTVNSMAKSYSIGLWYEGQWVRNDAGSLFHYPTEGIARQAIESWFRDKPGIEPRQMDLEELFGDKLQRCPRRNEREADDGTKPDYWDESTGMAGGMTADHCSYCGSLHPDVFLAKLKEGATLIPTDKSYKAYIRIPSESGGHENKFYFQHLSGEQMREMVDLVNSRSINFGQPGYFYTRPYFMRPVNE